MTTRSSALAVGSLVARPAGTVYTVPADRTVIIKSAYFDVSAVTGNQLSLWIVRTEGALGVRLHVDDQLLASRSEWTGWAVLEAGDEIQVSYATGTVSYWISGTVLQGSAI